MTHKLFFALWPGEGTRAQLVDWSRDLHASCGGRATRPENLHLTLAFLGAVEDGRIGEVERAAGEVEPRAISLTLDRPGYWKHNRIAWAGASVVPRELEALVAELRAALAKSRSRFDPQAFVPHVTLLREARAPETMPRLDPIPWEAGGFVLARSPAARGGAYEMLGRWGP